MIRGLLFVIINAFGFVLALLWGPFWGLISYANIYFNSPDPKINWWASYIPEFRWSLTASALMIMALFLHRNKLSNHKFYSIKWMFLFLILTLFVTLTNAVHQADANDLTYKLLTFCITAFLIVKSLARFEQLRWFIHIIIGLAFFLSLNAYLYGDRIHARLEGIGPGDAAGSNEFGVLLAAIIPFAFAFILRGKRYEKIACILALPFLLNAFILCNSRGAFVSFIAGIGYGFFIAGKRLKRKILFGLICAIPFTLYLSDDFFIDRMSSLWRTEVNSQDALNELSTGRLEIFRIGLVMAKDHPFGVGPNGFREISRFYMPEEMLTVHPGAKYGVRAAHNSYLQVLVEQGIIGLIIFLTICIQTMYLLFVANKRIKMSNNKNPFQEIFIVSLNISYAVSMMGGMFGAQVYYEFLWWQIAIAVVSYSFICDKESHINNNKALKDHPPTLQLV